MLHFAATKDPYLQKKTRSVHTLRPIKIFVDDPTV
jgi:hypothetical protein